MKQKVVALLSMFAVMFIGLNPAHSATTQELERQISELSGKVEKMRTRARSAGGSGGHAKTTLHGYGELHADLNDSGHNKMDQHRFVIGIHSQLSDWISLNAEIDFEHAAQKLEWEFGYLDFQLSSDFGIRAGAMLIPVGHINEFHEPNKFLTVERPDVHKYIIPTTWAGGGAGIYGTSASMGVNYRVYLVNSVKSVKGAGDTSAGDSASAGNGGCDLLFKDTSGIRSGRGELNKRCFDSLAVTGRAEKMLSPGVNVAYSFYAGNTSHGNASVDGFMFLNEADIQIRKGAFEMNSTIANISIDDTAELNKFASDEGTASGAIGERIFGWNIQAGVHLLQLMGKTTKHDLVAHVMYESLDTQADLDDTCTTNCDVDSKAARDIVHFGLTYKPIPEVAIKVDHKILEYAYADGTTDNQDKTTNLGIAYMY